MSFDDALQRMFNAGPDRWVATGNSGAEGGALINRGLSGNYSGGDGPLAEARSVLDGTNPHGGWVTQLRPGEDVGTVTRRDTAQYGGPLSVQGVVPADLVDPNLGAQRIERAMQPGEITALGTHIPPSGDGTAWAQNYVRLQQETGITPEPGTRGAQFDADIREALGTARYEEDYNGRFLVNSEEVDANVRRTLERYSAEGPPRAEGAPPPDPRPRTGPDARPGGDATARTTAGDAGGGTASGDCPNCIPGGGNRAGQAGTTGDAGVQAAPADPPPPPPGARSAPGAPPPPADGAEAFARAQHVGGAEHGGVVYAVGGTPGGDFEFYRYTPDGQYLGTVDRLPPGAVEFSAHDQIQHRDNPGAPVRRYFSSPDGRQYAISREGMVEAEANGTFRALSAAERRALPHTVQMQAMERLGGRALAAPDGTNTGFLARARTADTLINGIQIREDAARAGLALGSDNVGRSVDSRAGRGGAPGPATVPAPAPRR
jgi:hypothetical protein